MAYSYNGIDWYALAGGNALTTQCVSVAARRILPNLADQSKTQPWEFAMGNILRVDAVYGNDSTALPNGSSYKTINAAVAAATSGTTIWITPGTYSLSAGITLPAGVSLRGVSVQTTIVQMLAVTANTTLLTMGANTRVEDLTLKLTSASHYTLTGITFAGTTSQTAKVRTCVLTVDNSSSSSGGSSTVTGALFSGTGSLTPATFSFNSIKGCTINIYSNGGDNKRGILVSNTNQVSLRDTNIYVAQPTTTTSTGSYVGIQVNDSNDTGSIQLRSTSVGTVTPTGGETYTASDILQTTPATMTDPTYLAQPGIQIGPGTELVTKTAGGKGFSVFMYPLTVYYALKGDIQNGTSGGYLWPGTMAISGTFPDTGSPPAYFRIQQPCLLSAITSALSIAPGTGNSLTLLVRRTPISTGTIVDTSFTVTFGAADTTKNFYNASLSLTTGDRVHLQVTYTGSNANTAHDLTVQLDIA
jgi:hypothetical protein